MKNTSILAGILLAGSLCAQEPRWPAPVITDDNFTHWMDFIQPKEAEGQKRYDAKLSGRAIYDESTDTFTEFQLLAVGQRHGGAAYNFRKNDPGPAPMGVALELSDGQGNPSRAGRTPRI
jgi:hypothetical protein